MRKCILPFSECVYQREELLCHDIYTSPRNGDAKCHRITGRRKMINRVIVDYEPPLFPALPIKTYRGSIGAGSRSLYVYLGEKLIATCEWKNDTWHLVNEFENQIPLANNEIDAVNKLIEYLGYATSPDKRDQKLK